MNDFKVGDRVEYFGPSEDILALSPFLIAGFYGSGNTQYVKIKGIEWYEPLVSNLRHIEATPTPDVITINRADLPEIVVNEAGWVKADTNYLAHIDSAKSSNLRLIALHYLAAVEFLEAREKVAEEAKASEKEAADKLAKRRDELAGAYFEGTYHHLARISYRRAIDRIIELEDSRG